MTINYPLWAKPAAGYGKVFKIIFKTTNCRDYDAEAVTCKKYKKIINVDKEIEYLMYIDNGTELTYSETLSINGNTLELK
jgi:hypothetical protein